MHILLTSANHHLLKVKISTTEIVTELDKIGFSSLSAAAACVAYSKTSKRSTSANSLAHNFTGSSIPVVNSTYAFIPHSTVNQYGIITVIAGIETLLMYR